MCVSMYILWLLIVVVYPGKGEDRLQRNQLNFGYGVNFKYNGELHNNLDRVWVVHRINLPKKVDLEFKPINFRMDCSYHKMQTVMLTK